MSERDRTKKRRNIALLSSGILSISSISIIASIVYDVIYTPVAKTFDIFLPFWLVGLTSAVAVVIMYPVIGLPVAKRRLHDLPLRKSIEKQLLWGLLFLPLLTLLTESVLIYIVAIISENFNNLQAFPNFGIVLLWYNTAYGVIFGISCVLGLYWLSERIRSRDDAHQ